MYQYVACVRINLKWPSTVRYRIVDKRQYATVSLYRTAKPYGTVPYRGIYYVRLVRGIYLERRLKFRSSSYQSIPLPMCLWVPPKLGGWPLTRCGRKATIQRFPGLAIYLAGSLGDSCCVAGVNFLVELTCWADIGIADWGAFFSKFVLYRIYPCLIILLWIRVFFSKYRICCYIQVFINFRRQFLFCNAVCVRRRAFFFF